MLLELLFNNSLLIISSFVIIHLFVYYSFGAVLQEYFSFKKSNRFLSIPVGYIGWTLLTIFVYFFPILFNLNTIWFTLMGTIKSLGILFVILLYYRAWMPRIKDINKRNLIRSPIGYAIIVMAILLVVGIIKYQNWGETDIFFKFALVNGNWGDQPEFDTLIGLQNYINNLDSIEDIWENISDLTSIPTLSTIENYETTYYWMALIVERYNYISLDQMINIVMPILLTTVIACSILGTTVDSEKSIISYAYSAAIVVLVCLAEVYIGPWQQMFYVIPALTISIMLLFNYSTQVNPHDNLLTTSLISTTTLIAVTHWATPIIIIMGVAIVALCIINDGSVVKMLYRFVTAISIPVIAYTFIMFASSITVNDITFTDQFVTLIVVTVLFTAIITPLRSLARSSSRREDLVSFEANVKEKSIRTLTITAVTITVLCSLWLFLIMPDGADRLKGYFGVINSKLIISIPIYLAFIILPTILILIFNVKYKYVSMLNIIPYLTFMLNPITFTLICTSAGWELSWYIIFIPELMVITLWGINELIKWIPEKLKI